MLEYGDISLTSYTRMNSMKTYFGCTRSLVLLIPIIVLSACSSDSANTDPNDSNAILFEPCLDVSGLDCGAFEVPLIHDSTDNRKISIQVARLPGTGDGPTSHCYSLRVARDLVLRY